VEENCAKMEQIDRKQLKRVPAERHQMRMRALYVDLNDAESDWLKPSASFTVAEAFELVLDATNAYAMKRDRLMTPGALSAGLDNEFEVLGDRSPLPEVRWPRMPI
jgi:hypothetical protein